MGAGSVITTRKVTGGPRIENNAAARDFLEESASYTLQRIARGQSTRHVDPLQPLQSSTVGLRDVKLPRADNLESERNSQEPS